MKLCNFIEWKNIKIIYRRYGSAHHAHRIPFFFSGIEDLPPLTRVKLFSFVVRYASLFFIFGVDAEDNELMTLETIHHFVEILDRYFGNVPPFPSFKVCRLFYFISFI